MIDVGNKDTWKFNKMQSKYFILSYIILSKYPLPAYKSILVLRTVLPYLLSCCPSKNIKNYSETLYTSLPLLNSYPTLVLFPCYLQSFPRFTPIFPTQETSCTLWCFFSSSPFPFCLAISFNQLKFSQLNKHLGAGRVCRGHWYRHRSVRRGRKTPPQVL